MTLSEFLETVYVPLRLRGRSPNSARLLRHAVRQFEKFLRRPATLADLDDLTVAQFLAARGAKLSPYSVERERCGLLALWRLAADRRLVDLRPCVQAEILPERTPRAFTVPELERLFDSAAAERGFVGPLPAGVFWFALVSTLFETGERVAAILQTPRECWTPPYLRVPAGVRKGRRVERVYQVSDATAAAIDAAAKHGGDRLFGWEKSDDTIYKNYNRITKRAGLGTSREVKFHALRKSTASHLTAAGIDATAYLGHGSDRVTRRHYLDPRIVTAGQGNPASFLPRIRRPSA